MTSTERLYAEDLVPGQDVALGSWTLSEHDIIAFARVWDPQAMHVDRESARDGAFGEIIASGLQTMAVYQRLIVDALWCRVAGKAGMGLAARFRRPVRPGATLTGVTRIAELRERPGRGDAVVVAESRLVDEAGQVVLEVTGEGLVELRGTPPAR